MRSLWRLAVVLAMAVPACLIAQADTATQRVARRMVTAQDSALEAATTMLASELRCPVCQGNSIQDSPSELALQMRDLIRDQLRAGKPPEEVRAYFVDKYGEWILLAPKATGFNLVVYLVPALVILVGGAVVWRFVRRVTATPTDPASSR